MLFKPLGATAVRIPEVGIGTWEYHGGPEPLRKGLEAGALFIDTAESYGSETTVAEAISGLRERVFLASKVSPRNFRRADLLKAAEGSLARLRTDYLDLYQLHKPNEAVPLEETLGALEELVEQGKVRFIGVSNFSREQLHRARGLMCRQPIVANQVRFSLIDRTIEQELLPYCQQNQITVIAYSPLARGFQRICDCDPAGILARMGKRTGRTPAQVALNWCLCREGVVIIPKGSSVEHVVENCGASDWRLTLEQVREIDGAILYRRRGRLESLLRASVPSSLGPAVKFLSKIAPRGLRRRLQ